MGTRTGARGFKNLSVFASSLILALICLFFGTSRSSAQREASSSSHESERAAQVRALNNSVLQLHGQMQENASGAAGIRGQAATVLALRAAALQTLMKEDPHAALSFAFSPELLADLAAKFPDLAGRLESHATLSGPIEQWTFDNANLQTYRSEYRMKSGTQSLILHFAGRQPNLAKGNVFQVTGVVIGGDMAVAENSSISLNTPSASSAIFAILITASSFLTKVRWPILSLISLFPCALSRRWIGAKRFRQVATCAVIAVFALNPDTAFAQSSTCSAIGVQNVAVLLVTFPGVTPPSYITQQSVSDMFFSSTGPSLDGYWREASYGQTSATGNVFGWFTLDSSYQDCSRMDLLRDAAIAAAANTGVNFQNYNRIFIVTTDFGCGWTGVAGGTCMTLNSPTGSFVASTSYLDAVWQQTQQIGAETAAHEGGHNFGLGHAQSRTFTPEALGPLGTPGTVSEYGDPFSDMSVSNIGLYAAPHKAEGLNWISNGNNYQAVQSSGTWTLQPLETNPAGLVALKVQRGTGNAGYYLWIEYRQAIDSYDSTFSSMLQPGVLIHYEDPTTGSHTQLLDFTPGDGSLSNAALMTGTTWADPYSDLSLSVAAATSSSVTVNVTYNGIAPCTSSAPSVVVSPLNPSIYPGQAANYSATVTNNDSPGCSSNTISLGSVQPTGWTTALSSSSVTLNPGQSALVSMGKGAPSGIPVGTYPVNMTASTAQLNATGTANATVISPPPIGINIATNATSFVRPSTVSITASVTSAGNAASAATVIFTLTTPNGSTTTQTSTASSSGTAIWNYRLNSRSMVGSYSVTAQAALGSGNKKGASATQMVTSNPLTFVVQ